MAILSRANKENLEQDKFIESQAVPGQVAVAVANPDGSSIASGGVAAYSDGSGTTRQGLVDADRHVQADVLTLPAVSVGSSALPSGAATEATLSSLNTKINTEVTADYDTGAGTQTMKLVGVGVPASGGAAAVPGDATNGLDVDVTRLPASTVAGSTSLPAGTNNIGDVDVLSVIPGTSATSMGKAEDAAHASGDTGTAVWGVRNEAKAASSGTNGDYNFFGTNRQGEVFTAGPGAITLASSDSTPITTATDTTLIAAPSAGNHIRVHYIHASNSSATATDVMWRDGAAGARRFRTTLAQNSIFAHSLKGYWDLASATALVMTTSAAGSIHWTVEYEVVPD